MATVVPAQVSSPSARSIPDCMTCHEKNISAHDYNSSVHQSLKCTACHVIATGKPDDRSVAGKTACIVTYKPMDCSSCHSTMTKEHKVSVHNSERLPVPCSKCHANIHTITSIKNNKVAAAKLCIQCHQKESTYFKSIHYTALAKGNNDAPTCTDCHGLHAIKKIHDAAQSRIIHTQACMKCHAAGEKMARNKVTTIA
ncbi:MAG: hypothetical protein WCL00_04925, partial [Bacteroidota bacterium]